MNAAHGDPPHAGRHPGGGSPQLARNADHEANPLYPVPVLMDAQELQALYRLVMPKTEDNYQ